MAEHMADQAAAQPRGGERLTAEERELLLRAWPWPIRGVRDQPVTDANDFDTVVMAVERIVALRLRRLDGRTGGRAL
jgi:hypothetical protein